MAFADRLVEAIRKRGNSVVVGIDPRAENLPRNLLQLQDSLTDLERLARAFEEFGRRVIDVVAALVPAVKFQSAFYERLGPAGVRVLADSMSYARQRDLIVLFDGKRNDIGSTAEAYAEGYLGRLRIGDRDEVAWRADAVTLNPYLGTDGIQPFLDVALREEKGLFVLVRTSNPSAGELQDLDCGGQPLYRRVGELVARWGSSHRESCGYSAVGAVVGATGPSQLDELREALPGVFFLVPGYGSQGGTARDVAAAFDDRGLGALVNNSRGIIFAHENPVYRGRYGENWEAAVESATQNMIAELKEHTSMSQL